MLSENFVFRPCNNNDIEAIRHVIFPVLREYGLEPSETGKDKDLDDIEANYFANNGYFGVVVDIQTKKIVGTVGLFSISKYVCELRKMYLIKSVRGKGLGKLMLNAVIKIAKEKNYKEITLETISPLKEAIALYRQFGFIETEPAEINDRVDKAFKLNIDRTLC